MPGDTILVTGGNGFLGQHVIKHLQERADFVREIRVFDVIPFQKKLEYKENKPLVSIVGDVIDIESIMKAVEGVNCVMHLAGVVNVDHLAEIERMEEVNVKGTQMVIQACIEKNVERLIYCSSMNVAIGYSNVVDGTEASVNYPEHFLYEQYAETKCKGEKAVLKANGAKLSDGNKLRSVVLRPVGMYGELDSHSITTLLNFISNCKGILLPVANKNSWIQFAYVGNVSWAFVCASREMRVNQSLEGEAFFITDDTPLNHLFGFSKPYIESVGYKILPFSIPYWLMYAVFIFLEFLAWVLSPLYQFELPCSFSSILMLNMKINFVSSKAKRLLSYSPLFDPAESQRRSILFYNKAMSSNYKNHADGVR